MRVGTKSVIFGTHCFFIHPWFVAYAWWKLYGFPLDPRLWFAFFLHDIGYIGKPNMDGPEGKTHPEVGARIMAILFDGRWRWYVDFAEKYYKWGFFTLAHSRDYAKHHHIPPSRLCVADKLAMTLEPRWFYMIRARATGELTEYVLNSFKSDPEHPMAHHIKLIRIVPSDVASRWHKHLIVKTLEWVIQFHPTVA